MALVYAVEGTFSFINSDQEKFSTYRTIKKFHCKKIPK
jgi:hypothetical protein